MDEDITPYERIEMLFHAIFFLRIWRKWILKSKYILRENFITLNAYLCTEINGANLLKLIRTFREENRQELFLTTLFDSQGCERAFRQLRSMGTPNFTKINFTLLELLHMIRRLEVQTDIIYTKLSKVDIKVPKLEKKRRTTKIYALPTEEEIEDCLSRAKRFALNDAVKFGMNINAEEIDHCEISISKSLNENANENVDDSSDFEIDDAIPNEPEIEDTDDMNETPQSNDIFEEEDTERAFVSVTDHTGRKVLMRKRQYVWLLSEGTKKISSDRLIRVQEKHTVVTPDSVPSISDTRSGIVYVTNNIRLGDWCVFNGGGTDNDSEMIFIGLIHAFRFANRKLVKDKIYKFDSVNFSEKPNLKQELEVLSSWYVVNDKAALVPSKEANHSSNHYFIRIEKYIATLSISPNIDPDTKTLFFSATDFKIIEDDILKAIQK